MPDPTLPARPVVQNSERSAAVPGRERGSGAPRPPRHRVAPRARTYWLVSRVLALVVVLAVLLVPAFLWDAGRPWLLWGAGVATVLLAPGVVLSPWLRYRTHRWEATETAVYARTGWLGRQWRIAPLSRVQTVEARRTVLHWLLGLAAVSVTTASAQGAVVIEGLDAAVAEELVTQLTDAVANTQGDAT